MATKATSSALRALAVEYKSIQEEPVEGFCVKLVNEDLFEWEVAIFGPRTRCTWVAVSRYFALTIAHLPKEIESVLVFVI